MNKLILAAVIGFAAVLSGCATSRGLIEIPAPQQTKQAQQALDTKKIVIVIAEDNRTFQDKPHSPDIPSLKGGLAKATADDKAKAVARKRDGFGKALGDILLKNETVSALLEKRVTNALEQAGYEVLENNEENKSKADLVLDIKINKFWSWFQPGFVSIKIHSEIDTNIIDVKDPTFKPIHIYSKVTKTAQVANGAKWIENINQALTDYESKLILALPKSNP